MRGPHPSLPTNGVRARWGTRSPTTRSAQLEAELRASTVDLHASRVRLVEAAHEERRRIERDLHDSVLTAAAQRMPIAVSVRGTTTGRYAEEIEVAVYFCCLEALQNVVKHGGAEAGATVRLFDDHGLLCSRPGHVRPRNRRRGAHRSGRGRLTTAGREILGHHDVLCEWTVRCPRATRPRRRR